MGRGRTDLARLFAVARTWLFRVSDELIPLQFDGASGLDPDDTRWHSAVAFAYRNGKVTRATVTLRTRKNAPQGDQLTRFCTCGPVPESQVLCGVCALRGQVLDRQRDGASPRAPLFDLLQGPAALKAFRAAAAEVGLSATWHAFRRGMATDMLVGGSSLAEILLAGGWKSAAFPRYLARKDMDARVSLEYALAESGDDA